MNTASPAIIILAAGASSRLGQPKQLLPWQGTTLLQHAIDTAVQVVPKPVVVTGAHHQQLQAVLDAGQVTIVYNHQWQQGMASSIRCGLLAVLEQPVPPQQVLFMVCDQPFVSAQLLQSLIAVYERTRKPVVASAYANTLGIPALFHTSLFAQLLGLQGDTGARKIIQQHAADTAAVAFPQGTIDVDTLEAYREITRP